MKISGLLLVGTKVVCDDGNELDRSTEGKLVELSGGLMGLDMGEVSEDVGSEVDGSEKSDAAVEGSEMAE